ncbi:branched-chain amino acid ABC transporter permease [Rhizobium herbae]|uniref:Branched-chain amino acid ABC transporter permease n=1 Tax=Rhizobium herbae TaxID=508661 RepID=A0ABS7HEV5_9HYPH|nr:branched-chain amino acid ABC transporter permease [Rhizobium herbae]MBW9064798.1 branched-chain amino acid ABC transporter permease [Rhizobium herbae]
MNARANFLAILAAVAVLAVLPSSLSTYSVYVLCSWMVFSIAAMGLNLTLGFAGQVSLAQAAFMGIGAYTTALMTMAGIPWPLAMIAAAVECFLIGLVLGYPALRVQHHFLAFVTLAFNALVFLVLRNEEWLTGGTYGVVGIPRPSVLGFSTNQQTGFYYVVFGFFLVLSAVLYGILRSPWGRAFQALRENPIRANSLGVDIRRMTLLAFAIGSAYGGIAGGLLGQLVQFIDPNSFTLTISLKVLLMVIVGGAGYFFGPYLGALLVILMPEFLRFTEGYYLMLYALLVIVLMISCPKGLLGIVDRIKLSIKLRQNPSATAWEQGK